ncbi:nucleolar MIF4G domain-containing protein 1 [Erinaceus europaeus]|uniref:Nucleolar MIF4G domain-containing protein 1 n=1 Tax=Erinaceus europaeus TaxID=9365 RepID=A0ABM3XS78_ERIEU|nr:nucleolar MIF4G domain-containing protein 1 [Erinaceus europaeus]
MLSGHVALQTAAVLPTREAGAKRPAGSRAPRSPPRSRRRLEPRAPPAGADGAPAPRSLRCHLPPAGVAARPAARPPARSAPPRSPAPSDGPVGRKSRLFRKSGAWKMAAPRGAGVRARGGGRGRRGPGALRRLKLAVEGFVQARGGAPEGGGGPRAGRRAARPSGRERRREKRRLRRARRAGATTSGDREPPGGVSSARSRAPPGAVGDAGSAGKPGPPRDGAGSAGKPGPPRDGAGKPGKPRPPRDGAGKPGKPRPPRDGAGAAGTRDADHEEDRELRRLERCLGLGRGKALPLSFARDGLDYVLGALGAGSALPSPPRRRPDDRDGDPGDSDDRDSDPDGPEDGERGGCEDEDMGDGDMDDGDEEDEDDGDMGDGGDDDRPEREEEEAAEPEPRQAGGDAAEEPRVRRVRFAEDSMAAEPGEQVWWGNSGQVFYLQGGGRYLPPQARGAEVASDAQKTVALDRLRRQVQGLVNRLSEPNLASVSAQLEELFLAHSRKDVKDTLTAVLLAACAPPEPVPGRLVREHVLLLAVLHRRVGAEVGAHFLEAVVRSFEAAYGAGGGPGKECENLCSVLAQLYNFGVVAAGLVLGALRRLLAAFGPRDLGLALQLLRDVGFSLRRDDAAGLRELIAEAQARAAQAGAELRDQTRVRFMLDTMLALKNNDVRKIPGYDPEPVERLRKLQRTLVLGAGSGSDSQLRVSWDAILNADRTGRWWIVGSSWSGAPMIEDGPQRSAQKTPEGTVSAGILELARSQRMNTDVRRTIFCTIVTSEDFLDAFEKLLRLGLKEQQEREVVHVLVACCLQETTFNPFYAFLAAKLCSHERRFQVTLQFSVWDRFRELETLGAGSRANLAQLLTHLLKSRALPLSVLKVVEFSELDKPRVCFLRRVLRALLRETEAEDLGAIFARVADNPKLAVLREGLRLFISHFLLRGPQACGSVEEAGLLRERADLAARALQGRGTLSL